MEGLELYDKAAGIESGIIGAPDSIPAGDGDLLDDNVDDNVLDTSVLDNLEEISDKLGTIVEKIEDKVDETETGENEEINEIKEILNAISEKEINIDEELKVSDEKNEEILIEVRETRNLIAENIEVAKEFVGIGFGVMLGIVVGYTIMRFLGR